MSYKNELNDYICVCYKYVCICVRIYAYRHKGYIAGFVPDHENKANHTNVLISHCI